ncbi:MAG: ankyrin repeat domain-containing protein [Planctomycetia bacterium]|nr:ankyrin repeat domain-containing protein [Planctomycetia bacterium]
MTSIYLGDHKRVNQELKRRPAQALLRDEAGTPVLHHAVESLQVDLVKLLLRHGATVADVDVNGETPLHRVADMRRAPQEPARRMATLLLDRGADPDARNWDHVTALHQAVRARNLAVVEVLLARGADPNARDKSRGSTPLRRAVSATGAGGTAGTAELMVPLTQILLKYGADPDARDKRGVTVRASAKAPEVCAVLDQHRRKTRGAKKAQRTTNDSKGKATRTRRRRR